jgi:hypothetical protein
MTSNDIDGFVSTREVCVLTKWGPRWLHDKIRSGDFPAPDVPAIKRGAPNRWRSSTVRKALDALQARAQSARGAHIEQSAA